MATVHNTRRKSAPRRPHPTMRPGKLSRGVGPDPVPRIPLAPVQARNTARAGQPNAATLETLAIRIDAARAAAVCIYTALRQYHADIDVDAATALQRAVSDPLAEVVEQMEVFGKEAS